MKRQRLFLITVLVALCGNGTASITEIRKDFFNRTTNLPATAIMSAPVGDASYLISIYESTTNCAVIPVLRWTDENGIARSQQGTGGLANGSCYLSVVSDIRVHAKTKPTVETGGDEDGGHYSLYVSGIGFWTTGAQGQAGLSEVTGTLPTKNLIYGVEAYASPTSANALLVAYSIGYAGKDVPFFTWSDEYGTHSQQVPVDTSVVIPLRIAGSTGVWVHTFPGDTTWYALIVFDAPAKGAGPFLDYEANLLDWTNATYPNLQTIFTTGSAGANILLLSNISQQANGGTLSEGLQVFWPDQTAVPCAAALTAGSAGTPASCIAPAFIAPNSPLQIRTYNTPGSPWGLSPAYSAEVDVLQF